MELLSILGAVIATGGLLFTALTYRSGQRWKSAELARQLVERLSTDDELAFCTRSLDWGVGPLVIPEKHRPLFADDRRVMEHDPLVLAEAVRPQLGPNWRTPESLTYRHSFDAFFTYLLRVADQVRSGHVTRDQLVGIDYYLDLVAEPPYLVPGEVEDPERSGASESTFRPFVRTYYQSLEHFIWSDPRHDALTGGPPSRQKSLPS